MIFEVLVAQAWALGSSFNFTLTPLFPLTASNMKVLNINDNTISFLPDSFGDCLPSLEILAATKNNLRRLPSSIGKLAKLKSLTLSHNKLNEV